MKKSKLQDVIYCSIFVTLMIVTAFIKIPFPLVPLTMQFAVSNLAGILLGKKNGAVCVAVYILLGLIGLPVFANGGGVAYVLMPTFGYILGMAAGTWAAGTVVEIKKDYGYKTTMVAGAVNLICVYAIGFAYLLIINGAYLGVEINLKQLFVMAVLVSLPGDIIKCIVSSLLAKRVGWLFRSDQ